MVKIEVKCFSAEGDFAGTFEVPSDEYKAWFLGSQADYFFRFEKGTAEVWINDIRVFDEVVYSLQGLRRLILYSLESYGG